MLARNLLRLVSAHLARRDADHLTQELDPINDGTDPNSELLRHPIAGHAAALIFMLMMERWPKPDYQIDHRDGDVFNCRWDNLREVAAAQNNASPGSRNNANEGLEKECTVRRVSIRS
jgi:hypothetical protein